MAGRELNEQIALAVAEANSCEYCASVHTGFTHFKPLLGWSLCALKR
ncbi:MAG: carboxymuconolactone decarboxylase family protein [Tolypothrix brevis GSE-NOS-MK-07-07A]|nr:carboxymuconolactone decarboxylase family protein [Tolypothrix brevis GSE-NOS-MK-07-07A]